MAGDASESEKRRSSEWVSTRWIALGTVLIMALILTGEKLVWIVVNEDTRVFLEGAVRTMAESPDNVESASETRREARRRLLIGPVLAIVSVLLVSPFLMGMLLGYFGGLFWNGPLAGVLGVFLALVASAALSMVGMALCLMFGLLASFGSLTGIRLRRKGFLAGRIA